VVDLTDELMEEVGSVVTAVAHALARDFRAYTSAQDISQELWLWVFRHENKVLEYVDREDKDEQNRGLRALHKTMMRLAMVYCRREKAKAVGYLPSDEYFYTRSLVSALIMAVHNEGKMVVNQVSEGTRRAKLASEGNDILAMISDVESALEILDPSQQELLHRVYGEGVDVTVIAAESGVTRQAVDGRVNRALDRMIKELGGEYPYK
jgi:DNA-directed RNA polymerase specialized sigma24 family protein